MQIRTPPARVLSLLIPSRFVGALQTELQACGDVMANTPGFELASAESRMLLNSLRWVAMEIDQDPGLLNSIAAPHLEAMLKARFIAATTPSRMAERRSDWRLTASMASEIETWIHANLQEPISVELLAHRFGISVRTLQVMFRSRRECSPTEFVRRARLWAVRSELRQSTACDQQIRFVASRYGLIHQGRFASHYRALFGELPSETVATNRHFNGT